MTTFCTDFEQNRLTFISKSAPVSQAEALKTLNSKEAAGILLRTFTLIVSAHAYCARKFTRHVMHRCAR